VARIKSIILGAIANPIATKAFAATTAGRLLRHTDITTTQRYMHLDDKELADAQDLID
jgi:hypothetical protein